MGQLLKLTHYLPMGRVLESRYGPFGTLTRTALRTVRLYESSRVCDEPYERFLRDVFGRILVTREGNRSSEDQWLVGLDERGERAVVPLARVRWELTASVKRNGGASHRINEAASRPRVYPAV